MHLRTHVHARSAISHAHAHMWLCELSLPGLGKSCVNVILVIAGNGIGGSVGDVDVDVGV